MDPELLNCPEPAYRRRAIASKTLETSEFDVCPENIGTFCDNNEGAAVEPVSGKAEVREEQLIDVEIEVERHNAKIDDSSSNLENSGGYVKLLSSLSAPSGSQIDLLTSDAPLAENLQDEPAQLILESSNNGISGTSKEETKNSCVPHQRDQHGNFYSSQPGQYYDDTHPFLV